MRSLSAIYKDWGPLLFAVILLSCTTAKPIMEWRDPGYMGGPFDHILIVGMSDQVTVRRLFENTFVDRLQEENVKATPSFAVMPEDTRPSEESIKAIISEIKFDSVIVTHLVGVEENEVYHPPSYGMAPYGGFYGYYGYVGGYVYEPGYYTRYDRFRLETNLYDVKTEKLIWSMQSESLNPSSEEALIKAKIKTVIDRLKDQKLIAGQ